MAEGRVQRLLRLVTLLQSGQGRQVNDLMAELGVSRRTLFRDLRMLNAAGVPYRYSPKHGYRVDPGYFLPPVNFTLSETLGLLLLAKLAKAQRDQPLLAPAFTGLSKLASLVPRETLALARDLIAPVTLHPTAHVPAAGHLSLYDKLQQCIDQGRACRITYKGPEEKQWSDCRLEPYALHFSSARGTSSAGVTCTTRCASSSWRASARRSPCRIASTGPKASRRRTSSATRGG